MIRVLIKLAWRDLHRSRWKAGLIMAALSMSIAAVHGVRGAELAARHALQTDLRRWLGADVAATTGESFDAETFQALDAMRSPGVAWTWVTWNLAMARSTESPDAVPTVVKVVDPQVYPLYPGIELEPALTLAAALRDDSVVVSEEVLEKLQVRLGDTIELAGHRFRITAILRAEADRLNGFAAISPRTILSRSAYTGSGMAGSGNSSKHSVLLRLPADADLLPVRAALQRILPEAGVTDYRESNQHAVSTVKANIAFLGMTAFLVMAVGAAGIVAGVRQHVKAQTTVIATLKILGAGTRQAATVFALQITMLLVCALVIGLPLGTLARDVALGLAGTGVTRAAPRESTLSVVAETLAVIVLALVPVFPQPVVLIRKIRPLEVLRGLPDQALEPRRGWRSDAWFGAGFLLLGVLGVRLVGSWSSALSLVTALMICLGLAVLLTRALLRGVRRYALQQRTGVARLGWRNAGHPLHGSQTLIVAMAMGLMLMIATYEVNRAVGQTVVDALPFDGANLLVGGFEAEHRRTVAGFVEQLPGVAGPPQLVTQARLRLASVDGVPIDVLRKKSRSNAIPEAWRDIGCIDAGGSDTVTVAADVAGLLHVRPGSVLEFAGRSRTLLRRVIAVREISRIEKFWYTFTMDCASLEPSSLHHLAAVQVRADLLEPARKTIAAQFPMLVVLTAEDLSSIGEEASRRMLGLTRMVAWYAIAASLMVLAAVVSASRGTRLREFAILSALGATPRTKAVIYSVELAVTGALAGVVGAVLSSLFLSVALSVLFDRFAIALGWRGAAAALAGSVFVTLTAGWLPVFRLLRCRPMESLRDE
ncbi:MAG: FtsX-like permease family protein [Bryobacterales bacterium]|nr:FtsX-like permease family protein [Bryobacterales bacterium]